MDKLVDVSQGGQVRKYKYDSAGQLLYENIPEQTATINDGTGTFWTSKYTYTDFGAVQTRTDARGVVTTYGYDTLNRLTSATYNTTNAPGVATTPNVTYSYETLGWGNGQLQKVSVGSLYEATNTYDEYGRVTSVAHKVEAKSYTTGYHYNAGSQPRQMAHMYTEYDSTGRLNSIKDSQAGWVLSSASYNIAGQVTASALLAGANSINESYTYDSQRMQLATQTATRAGTMLMSLTYSFQATAGQMGAGTTAGNAGQLMTVSGTIGGQTESASYTYDLLGRITTSAQTTNGTSAQRRFSYDRFGNRTGVWDATSGGTQIQSVVLAQSGGAPTNRLTSVTTSGVTKNYTYDSAGNVTNDGSHTYVYDAENRVASVDSGAYSYGYDHQNRRVKKTGGGATTHYLWQGSQVIAEHNGSTGAVQVAYYYAGSRLVAKQETGQARKYFLGDRLSVRLVLDGSGNVSRRQGHLPFGEEIAAAGEHDKHQFTSYEKDSETGLDYAVNRYDSVSTGRFTTVDPKATSARKEVPQTWNRYTYTGNDPINMKDPWGLDPIDPLAPKPFTFSGPLNPGQLDPCSPSGATYFSDGFEISRNILCMGLPMREPVERPARSCQITVYFRALRYKFNTVGFHAYIVLQDSDGSTPTVYSATNRNGYIYASYGDYVPGSPEWPEPDDLIRRYDFAPRLEGCEYYHNLFTRAVQQTNRARITYRRGVMNSNSFAYTLLLQANLSINEDDIPLAWWQQLWGWGNPLPID